MLSEEEPVLKLAADMFGCGCVAATCWAFCAFCHIDPLGMSALLCPSILSIPPFSATSSLMHVETSCFTFTYEKDGETSESLVPHPSSWNVCFVLSSVTCPSCTFRFALKRLLNSSKGSALGQDLHAESAHSVSSASSILLVCQQSPPHYSILSICFLECILPNAIFIHRYRSSLNT